MIALRVLLKRSGSASILQKGKQDITSEFTRGASLD